MENCEYCDNPACVTHRGKDLCGDHFGKELEMEPFKIVDEFWESDLVTQNDAKLIDNPPYATELFYKWLIDKGIVTEGPLPPPKPQFSKAQMTELVDWYEMRIGTLGVDNLEAYTKELREVLAGLGEKKEESK